MARSRAREALAFGLFFACSAVAVLGLATNIKAAALLAFTIFFYVVVYTVWLKRNTPQNIVIGGAAGALPPVIGWAAATGEIGLEPLILFLIIFLWTPPHFWALSLNRAGRICAALACPCCRSLPEEPQRRGRFSSMAFFWCRFRCCRGRLDLQARYTARRPLVCGAIFIVLALRLHRSGRPTGELLTACSCFPSSYLFVLFAAL